MRRPQLDVLEHLKLDRRVKLRYGILLEPVCLVLGHLWTFVEGLGPFDRSGSLCRRCGRFHTGVFEAGAG